MEKRFLSINEAAQFLGVSRSKFYNLLKNDTFPASFNFSGAKRWDVNKLDEWAQAQTAGQTEKGE
nr:helix-turn-helix domain-containing protein [Synergistaceae bacterium]